MASTRNEILKAFKTQIATVAGVDGGDVRIVTFLRPDRATGKPAFNVSFRFDHGLRRSGGLKTRTLQVMVALVFRVDPSSDQSQLEQANEQFDQVHASLEAWAEGNLPAGMREVQELEPGIQPGGFDDGDNAVYIGCVWEVKYERPRGSA